MNDSKYIVTVKFTELEDLFNFFDKFNDTNLKKLYKDLVYEMKPTKKENDKRGKHIIKVHQDAKEYKLLNPEISYKECFKIVSKNKINNNNI